MDRVGFLACCLARPIVRAAPDRPTDREAKRAEGGRAASEPLQELEKLVDAINAKHGWQVVQISPVGEATIKLVQRVAESRFPGLADPAERWTDFDTHSNRHVLALTAYRTVATTDHVSPVGPKSDF